MLELSHVLPLLLVLEELLLLPDGVLLLLAHPRLRVVAREHPPLLLDLLLRLIPHLPFHREPQEPDGVRNQVLLDAEVEGGVGREGGRVVDLEEPGLRVLVEEDVEAEDLEAQGVLHVVGLGRPVGVGERGLGCDEGLQDDVFDTRPDLLRGDHGLAFFQEVLAVID